MIGVYDSGSGGLTALAHLVRLAPDADIYYRGDLSHAPYGTKSADALVPIIEENTKRFLSLGVEHILVACVTASSLYSRLSPGIRAHLYPITHAVADAAVRKTKIGKIGIVSTTRTMCEGVLSRRIAAHGILPTQSAADALVPLAERGITDSAHPEVRRAVSSACLPHKMAGVDTLVLGCTHFPLFTEAFAKEMGDEVFLIDSGYEGALAFLNQISKNVLLGEGRLHFI